MVCDPVAAQRQISLCEHVWHSCVCVNLIAWCGSGLVSSSLVVFKDFQAEGLPSLFRWFMSVHLSPQHR